MTGAIFARGSCRALKWMALFGALLVLSAGEAVAQQSIVVSKASVSVVEGGGTTAAQTFTVTLGTALTGANTLDVAVATAATPAAANIGALTYTPSGPFTFSATATSFDVTVTAAEDDADNMNGSATVELSATGVPNTTVAVAEVDNDPSMMQAVPTALSVTEGDSTVANTGASFTLTVNRRGGGGTLDAAVTPTVSIFSPAANAKFEYSNDAGLTWAASLPSPIVPAGDTSFDVAGDGEVRLHVRAVEDDNTVDGTVTLLLQGTSGSGTIALATLTITEDDSDRVSVPTGQATAIVIAPSSLQVSEGGAELFTVSLNGTPETDVMVTANAGVPNSANDNADFRYTYGPLLANPDPTQMTFTFMKGVAPTPQTVTVGAYEDGDPTNGRTVITFSTATTGIAMRNLTLTEVDNDGAGIILSTTALQVQEGGVAQMYTIRLGSAPMHAPVMITPRVTSNVNAAVRVAASMDGATPIPTGGLVFNSGNWNQPQMVYVLADRDTNTTNGMATISHSVTTIDGEYAAVSKPSVKVTEIDSVRMVELTLSTDTVQEGQTATITATLGNSGDFTGAPTLNDNLVIALSKKAGSTTEAGDYSVSSITIPAGARSAAVTLMANHDHDADDEALTLTSSITGGGGALQIEGATQELSLDIEDDDTYTLTSDRTELPEGEKATLTVKVSPAAALRTKVAIDLYRASGATVKPGPGDTPDHMIIPIGQTTAMFELTTAKDRDKDHETIVAIATVGKESDATGKLKMAGDELTIMVRDAQADAVYTLMADPTFVTEAGGEQSVMVTVMADKAAAADTMLTLAVDDASTAMMDDYSIMPAEMTVMIAKGEKSGMAELMITPVADSMDEQDETIVLTAWMDDAMVGNAVTVTLIDGDSVSSGITAKSNAEALMVFEDAIMKAGGLQAGGESAYVDMSMLFNVADPNTAVSYSVSSSDTDVLGLYTSATDSTLSDVTLRLDPMMEGMSTVTVMAEAGNGMMEVRTLTAFTCSGACVSVNIDVGAAGTPVPALPLVGQGLLALFLFGAGVYRRYRSR